MVVDIPMFGHGLIWDPRGQRSLYLMEVTHSRYCLELFSLMFPIRELYIPTFIDLGCTNYLH